MEYFASAIPEVLKLSPFVALLAIWGIVLWRQFLKKDAAMTEQMIEGRDKLLSLTERMIVSQEQNTMVNQQVVVAQKENTQVLSQLSESNHDNHLALMRKIEELDTTRVKPIGTRSRGISEPKAQA